MQSRKKTKQHTFYYAVRTDTKEGSRRQKENKTCEAQKKVNSRQAVKKADMDPKCELRRNITVHHMGIHEGEPPSHKRSTADRR